MFIFIITDNGKVLLFSYEHTKPGSCTCQAVCRSRKCRGNVAGALLLSVVGVSEASAVKYQGNDGVCEDVSYLAITVAALPLVVTRLRVRST